MPKWPYELRRAICDTDEFGELTSGAKVVYHTLWLYSDANGRDVYPSLAELSAKSRYSRRHVINSLAELTTAGFVRCLRRRRKGSEKSDTTLYSFLDPRTDPESQRKNIRIVNGEVRVIPDLPAAYGGN